VAWAVWVFLEPVLSPVSEAFVVLDGLGAFFLKILEKVWVFGEEFRDYVVTDVVAAEARVQVGGVGAVGEAPCVEPSEDLGFGSIEERPHKGAVFFKHADAAAQLAATFLVHEHGFQIVVEIVGQVDAVGVVFESHALQKFVAQGSARGFERLFMDLGVGFDIGAFDFAKKSVFVRKIFNELFIQVTVRTAELVIEVR